MTKLANSAILAAVLWVLAPIAQGDPFCGTGGAQNGWQCTITGFATEEWCQHIPLYYCDVWNINWKRERNSFRIQCNKQGQSPVVCGHCYDEPIGCCGSPGLEEKPCVAPPEDPGS